MNYFAIERNGAYRDHILIQDNETDRVAFENYLNITYDELMEQEDLEDFIVAIMDATDFEMDVSDSDDSTIITLIGEDDIFIWSILIGTVDDELRYLPIDWKKDGKNYRYEN
jgi:hypothetical protein